MGFSTLPPGKRVVVRQLGNEPLETIERHMDLEEMPAPDPSRLSALDVIVQIHSASVGWVDLLMASGHYQHVPTPPYCPGLEWSGTVVWTGKDVGDRLPLGSRVLVDGFRVGPRSLGAYQQYGGFASYAVAPVEALIPIPGELSFDQACNLLGNYETAYHCLVERGRLTAGESVLIHGASGSTGMAAVQIAKLLGATVIATGRSEDKLRAVREQGADHLIRLEPKTTEDGASTLASFRDQVKSLTAGEGVHVVYDGVGGDVSLESLRCMRFGGRFLIVGWASTPFVARPKGQRGAPNANHLPTNLILIKGLDVLGCPTVISSIKNPGLRAPRMKKLLGWAAQGAIRPHVSHVFDLADFKTALRARWNSEIVGGCVVHPTTS